MARSLKLQWATSHYVYGVDDGVRVRFDVVCAGDLSSKIFAYRMFPRDRNGNEEGRFSHICSAPDLENFPEDGPTPGDSPAWFRLSYVDVLVYSVAEAENFIALVREDARRLIAVLKTMDTLFTDGTEVIGADCDPASSSSSSSLSSTNSASLGSLAFLTVVGTHEQSVGAGTPWRNLGDGAGSPVGASDSLGLNRSQVELSTGEASQVLLVQGFNVTALANDAIIEGIVARLVLRDITDGSIASSVSSTSSSSDIAATCPRLTFLTLQHPARGLGTNMAGDDCIAGPEWGTLTYGNDSDLWGFPALTGEELKDGAFGLGLVVNNGFNTDHSIVEIDGVELDIYYREEL